MILGNTWLELFPRTGKKHQVIIILLCQLSLNKLVLLYLQGTTITLATLKNSPFYSWTEPALSSLCGGSGNTNRWGLQVWTASAPELDASSHAANNRRGNAQEKEASLWACFGRWKPSWAAATAASTLQADDPSWHLSSYAAAAVFTCWPRFLWSGEAELCRANAVAHAFELEDSDVHRQVMLSFLL